jgi:hypothetical protein
VYLRANNSSGVCSSSTGSPLRGAPTGLPNADNVMEYGILLPCGRALSDEDIDFVTGHLQGLLDQLHGA